MNKKADTAYNERLLELQIMQRTNCTFIPKVENR